MAGTSPAVTFPPPAASRPQGGSKGPPDLWWGSLMSILGAHKVHGELLTYIEDNVPENVRSKSIMELTPVEDHWLFAPLSGPEALRTLWNEAFSKYISCAFSATSKFKEGDRIPGWDESSQISDALLSAVYMGNGGFFTAPVLGQYTLVKVDRTDRNSVALYDKMVAWFVDRESEQEPEDDEPGVKPSLASVLLESEAGQVQSKSWSEYIDEELNFPRLGTEKGILLLNVIRSRKAASRDSGVLIPFNLFSELTDPAIKEKFEMAAKATKSELVENRLTKLTVLYKDVFSGNPAQVESTLSSFDTTKPEDSDRIRRLANLAALLDFIGSMPTAESLSITGPGKKSVCYITQLCGMLAIEGQYNLPFASQKKLWKMSSDMRQEIASEIGPIVGGNDAAIALITSVEILHRKFVRMILNHKDQKIADSFRNELLTAAKPLFASCQEMYLRSCRQKTEIVKEQVPPAKKGGKPTVVEKKKILLMRPKVHEGPTRPDEAAMISRINRSLAGIEKVLPDRRNTNAVPSPVEELGAIEKGVNKLYSSLEPLGKVLTSRRQRVRMRVDETRAIQAQGAGGVAGSSNKSNVATNITQQEWTKASDAYIGELGEAERDLFWEGVYAIFGLTVKPEGEDILSEDAMRSYFEKTLTRLLSRAGLGA